MLLDLNRVTLEMVRGDTFKLSLPLNSGTREYPTRYTMTKDDSLYIGIMKPDQSFEHAEIRCMITHTDATDDGGNPVFRLKPSDTSHLFPGKYYMTVKLVSGEDVYTLVDRILFYITGSNPCC